MHIIKRQAPLRRLDVDKLLEFSQKALSVSDVMNSETYAQHLVEILQSTNSTVFPSSGNVDRGSVILVALSGGSFRLMGEVQLKFYPYGGVKFGKGDMTTATEILHLTRLLLAYETVSVFKVAFSCEWQKLDWARHRKVQEGSVTNIGNQISSSLV